MLPDFQNSEYRYTYILYIQTGLGAHPISHTMGTGSFPGVKRPGRDVDHPPPSGAEVKERVTLLSLWAFVDYSRVNFTLYFLYIHIYTNTHTHGGPEVDIRGR